MIEQSDDILMQQVSKGDTAAVAALYDRYGRQAFGLAYRVLEDGPAAEEAVQDAFLQIWRKADTFDPAKGAGFRAWLLTIVHNRAIDQLRKRSRHMERETELKPELPLRGPSDPVGEVLASLEGEQIREAMSALPDDQRVTIEQAYFQGLTHREIAERMGLPLGTVKGRLRLGLGKLHGLLEASAGSSRPPPA